MSGKILVEADLRNRAVERCDIAVYLDGKLIGTCFGKSYDDLPSIANEPSPKYQYVKTKAECLGEDCAGRTHDGRWMSSENRNGRDADISHTVRYRRR